MEVEGELSEAAAQADTGADTRDSAGAAN